MILTKGIAAGRVQGVGFRYFVQETATLAGLFGYVRNLEDGRVEFVLQGEQSQIDIVLDRIKEGPAYAKVESLSCLPLAPEQSNVFTDFKIRY